MSDGSLLGTLTGHNSAIYSITVSSDNTKVFTGSSDKTVIVWDLTTMKKLFTLGGNIWGIVLIKFDSSTSTVHTSSISIYQSF